MGTRSANVEAMIREGIQRFFPCAVTLKMHADQFTEAGWPDIACVINGRSVWIEVKCQPDSLKPVQVHKMDLLKKAGAIVCCAMEYKETGQIGFLFRDFDKFTWRKGQLPLWFPGETQVFGPKGISTSLNMKDFLNAANQ